MTSSISRIHRARSSLPFGVLPIGSEKKVGADRSDSGDLVDLKGFEPLTSSMPFKKYQSLTDVFTRNKRLSTRPRGLRWTPRGGFWASGLHADSGTPRTGWHAASFHARGSGLLYLLSAEGDNSRFFSKGNAHVDVPTAIRRRRNDVAPCKALTLKDRPSKRVPF
jgi:hypothetical protein